MTSDNRLLLLLFIIFDTTFALKTPGEGGNYSPT